MGLFVTALSGERRAFPPLGRMTRQITSRGSWWYAFLACSRWVGFRLDTLAAITLSFECILVMAVHNQVSFVFTQPAVSSTMRLLNRAATQIGKCLADL